MIYTRYAYYSAILVGAVRLIASLSLTSLLVRFISHISSIFNSLPFPVFVFLYKPLSFLDSISVQTLDFLLHWTPARFNRRHLYLASAIATIISLAAFGTTLLFATHLQHWHLEEQEVIIDWSSVIFGCILVFCVNLGVQPMANLMTSELFPAEVRALCKVKEVQKDIHRYDQTIARIANAVQVTSWL